MQKEKRLRPYSFESRLRDACKGLVLVSETDSDVQPVFGNQATSRTSTEVLSAIGVSRVTDVAVVDPEQFFRRLTTEKDWFDERQRVNAAGFKVLKQLLEHELDGLKVYRVGKIHIAIYVLGFLKDGRVAGVKMNAIET